MTESEARDWVHQRFMVSRETVDRLDRFAAMVLSANAHQNLISKASEGQMWSRHMADSAQLLALADSDEHALKAGASWLDLGSGPGFPGIVLAILQGGPVHMVEERKSRVAFLEDCCANLGLGNARIHGCKVERLHLPPVDVITARAFAPLARLIPLANSFSTESTIWVLPKGKSVRAELASIKGTWQGVFHVKHSLTDPEAEILIGHGLRKTGKP